MSVLEDTEKQTRKDEYDISNTCPFLELPKELRVLLYSKYLAKPEQKVMRLINRQVKLEVEQSVDFHIKIDSESFRQCRRLMALRADALTILSLPKRKAKPLTLKHPGKIRKVTFDGAVQPSCAARILKKCFSLSHLSFTNETLHYSTDFQQCRQLRETLESSRLTHLGVQFTRQPGANPYYPMDSNVSFFLNSTFKHLTSFKLFYSLWGNWLDLFLFLTRHAGSLQFLELQVGDRCDVNNTTLYLRRHPHYNLLEIIERDVLRKLQLKELRFRDEVLHLNPTSSLLIFEILAQQKSLEKLHFHSQGDMTQPMLSSIVAANQKTLQELVVYNFTGTEVRLPFAPPKLNMDMRQFSASSHLKVLALSSVSPNRRSFSPIAATSMSSLPSSLERIHLTGFNLELVDTVELSTKLPKLKELLIADCQCDLRFSKIFGSFLINCPSLEFVSISPVGPPEPEFALHVEADIIELCQMYSRFMAVEYNPIDSFGFEARKFTDLDREWAKATINLEVEEFRILVPHTTGQ